MVRKVTPANRDPPPADTEEHPHCTGENCCGNCPKGKN